VNDGTDPFDKMKLSKWYDEVAKWKEGPNRMIVPILTV
jgi:hypothetical protein